MCERRSGHPGLPVLNSPYGLCGRKATLNLNVPVQSLGAVWKSRGGRPGFPVPNSPYGLCGCKATLNLNTPSRFLTRRERKPHRMGERELQQLMLRSRSSLEWFRFKMGNVVNTYTSRGQELCERSSEVEVLEQEHWNWNHCSILAVTTGVRAGVRGGQLNPFTAMMSLENDQ